MKRKRWIRRAAVVMAVLAALFVLGYWYIEQNIRPYVISFAQARINSEVMRQINDGINEALATIQYDDIVHVTRDNENRIVMLKMDAPAMNAIADNAVDCVQQRIDAMGMQKIGIPLGTIIGWSLFTGRGPRIQVNVQPVGSVYANFISYFEEAGINQTRHHVEMEMTAHISIVAPAGGGSITVKSSMPVAESILIGTVPQTYLWMGQNGKTLDFTPNE